MLDVIIVGAGISGLTAAISLRRAGHNVAVYEKSSMSNEVGAAIMVPPNATRFLTAWGIDPSKWRWVKGKKFLYMDPDTFKTLAVLDTDKSIAAVGGTFTYLAHRVDLHNALKWAATRDNGPGTPVTIHLNSPVTSYDPLKPCITLGSGETVHGDVVIGADGVHSNAPEAILNRKNEPVAPMSMNRAYRFLIPVAKLKADPETSFFVQDSGGWVGLIPDNANQRRLIVYSCRDDTILNFVGVLTEEDEGRAEKTERWHARVDTADVVEKFAGYDPRLLKVMSKATDVMKWPLLYRHPLPAWNKGFMTLAGDAAHPMLPHQAQGGAQAMEDGLCLGIVLHGANSPQEIKERLQLYYSIRHKRASVIQILSNVGLDQTELVSAELRPYMPEDEIPKNIPESMAYNFAYDIVRVTLDKMKQHDATFKLPDDFFDGPVAGVPKRS